MYKVGDKVEYREPYGGWWGPFTVAAVHDYGRAAHG